MSYSLNFYIASLDIIQLSLSTPASQWFDNAYPLWLEIGEMEDNENSQVVWRNIVSTISDAVQQAKTDPAQSFIVQDEAALAIAAGIDSNAEFIDSMTHSSSSGEFFREEFLGWLGRHNFKQPMLLAWLTERALFGLVSESYPSWGYLTLAEITDLLNKWQKPKKNLDEDKEE